MNPRSTAILFVVAAAMAAFVYFYEIEGEQSRKDAEAAAKELFADLESESIESISLHTTDGRQVEARRVDQRWRIEQPLDFPGDDFAIDGIASTLASIQSESEIEEPRGAAVYGLDADAGVVRFTASGQQHALRIGNDAPVGSNAYAAVEGRDAVYIVQKYRVQSLRKAFDDLREKRIAPFDSTAARKLSVKWPDGGVVLERTGTAWRLVEPIQGPADERTVDDLVSSLSTLRASGFIDAPGSDAETGLDRPVFEARIELEARPDADSDAPPRVVDIALGGLSPDSESRIVRGAEKSLYTIPAARTDDFPAQLDPYRFRQLGDFSASDAKRVEMGFRTASGETVAFTATHSGEDWTVTPDAFEPGRLASMVSELSRLRADSILADELGTDELAAIGLDPPLVSISVWGEEAGAPLAEFRIGNSREQGIAAQIPDQTTVFQLAASVGENVPVTHEALVNRFLAAPQPAPAEAPPEPATP